MQQNGDHCICVCPFFLSLPRTSSTRALIYLLHFAKTRIKQDLEEKPSAATATTILSMRPELAFFIIYTSDHITIHFREILLGLILLDFARN